MGFQQDSFRLFSRRSTTLADRNRFQQLWHLLPQQAQESDPRFHRPHQAPTFAGSPILALNYERPAGASVCQYCQTKDDLKDHTEPLCPRTSHELGGNDRSAKRNLCQTQLIQYVAISGCISVAKYLSFRALLKQVWNW